MTEAKLKCSELEYNREIVFYLDPYYRGKKSYYTGNVLFVDEIRKTVCVSWLEGYKSRESDIPFEDCIAAYDENGEMMEFGSPCYIRGNSILLTDN